MGGGSADAAAVLKALASEYPGRLSGEELFSLALSLGSDVPFCMEGGTALASGRGERLKKLKALPFCHVVLCKPRFAASTPRMFAMLDRAKLVRHPDTAGAEAAVEAGDLSGLARRLYNVFEEMVGAGHCEIGEIRREMVEGGAIGAAMSGSGPTMFGLFTEENKALSVYRRLRKEYPETFLTYTVENV